MTDGKYFKIDHDGTIRGLTDAGKELTDISIPLQINGIVVKYISDYAFYKNTNLEKISIPNSVKMIGYAAFWGCVNLKSIKISDDLEYIPFDCFRECIKLTTITLPSALKKIGEYAFADCVKLKTIYIGKDLKIITTHAFAHCKSIKSVIYEGSEEDWNKIRIHPVNEWLLGAKFSYNR